MLLQLRQQFYRFNKPSKEQFVDYLNDWNGSNLTQDQLLFEDIRLLETDGKSSLTVKFSTATGWQTAPQPMTYYRVELSNLLRGQPLTIHATDTSPEGIYAALLAQYGLLIEPQYVVLTTIVDQVDYMLSFGPDHLIFFGSVNIQIRPEIELLGTTIDSLLDLRAYYADGNTNKPPLDLYTTNGEFLVDETIVPSGDERAYYEYVLHEQVVGQTLIETTHLVDVMKALTGDNWVSVPTPAPFNLYGASIVYNGLVSADYPVTDGRYGYVMAFNLGSQCTNLTGVGKVAYRYSESIALLNQPYNQATVLPIFNK